jgi:hypothetical protein
MAPGEDQTRVQARPCLSRNEVVCSKHDENRIQENPYQAWQSSD